MHRYLHALNSNQCSTAQLRRRRMFKIDTRRVEKENQSIFVSMDQNPKVEGRLFFLLFIRMTLYSSTDPRDSVQAFDLLLFNTTSFFHPTTIFVFLQVQVSREKRI